MIYNLGNGGRGLIEKGNLIENIELLKEAYGKEGIKRGGLSGAVTNLSQSFFFFSDCLIVFVCHPCCPCVTVLCILHCICK